jgi:VanZ family protein
VRWVGHKGALATLALAVVVGSVAPGRIVESWSAVMADLEAGATLAVQQPAPVTVFERFAAFFPLGWLAGRAAGARSRQPGAISCFAVALFALLLELTQSFIESRHARLTDFLLATVFGCIGAGVGSWLGVRPEARKVRRLFFAVLITGNLVVTLIASQSIVAAGIDEWDCSYPLLVANELTEDRPWLGRIRGLAIYPMALSAADIQRLATAPLSREGVDLRRKTGVLALYGFDAIHGQTAPQLLPDGPRDDLVLPPSGPSTWQIEDGVLVVQGPILVRSAGAANAICSAIVASKAFTAEVEVASADVAQGGPARILSQSADALHRNFTIGEEFGRLVARIRTPWNGENGAFLPLETETPVLTDGWHHIVFSYARGTASLFMDGAEIAPSVPYHKMMLVGEGVAIRIAFVAATLFWVMGLIASVSFRSHSLAVDCAQVYGAAALLPVLVASALAAGHGFEQDRLLLSAAALAPGLGMLVGRALARMQMWESRL